MNKAALGFVVPMMLVAWTTLAQPSSVQLSISQPENGDVVPRRLTVTGTSAGLATNKILVFVYAPLAERWFFQGEATVGADGSWEAETVVISGGSISTAPVAGRPEEMALDFQIVATAMSEVPPGLSGMSGGDFPLSGTLAKSPAVLVRRGN